MRADERVDRDGLALLERHRPLDRLSALDDEVAERRNDVLGRVQHGCVLRAAVTVGEVRRVVAEDDERAARSHRPGRRSHRLQELLAGQLKIEERGEVEGTRVGLVAAVGLTAPGVLASRFTRPLPKGTR